MARRRLKRRRWDAASLRRLRTLAAKRKPAPVIAKRLKRTERATRQKAFCLGLSLETRGGAFA